MKTELKLGWTEERTERAKRMWTEGKSARDIANDLGGVTRNAVIGKLTRLGLAGNVGVSESGELTPRRAQPSGPKRVPAPKPEKVTLIASRPPVDFKALEKAAAAEPPLMLKLPQLNTRTCKWPIGDVESPHFGFCGHRVMQGQPYCPAHCKAAFVPADKKSSAKVLSHSLRRFL